MNILCIGDVLGRPGRRILRESLSRLQNQYDVDFTVANGENAAGGFGLTPDKAEELLGMGIDVLTTGNHIWDKREVYAYLETTTRVVRPANYPPGVAGRGSTILESRTGLKVGVLNLQGRVFMQPLDCPFRAADALLSEIRKETPIVVVDFHAEATSEKVALGWHLDGRASVVFGTHTHVQTADERILPGGTAYITDIGMTGPHDSVIGMEAAPSIRRFLDGLPAKFAPDTGGIRLNGLVVEVDPVSGRATRVERINIPLEG